MVVSLLQSLAGCLTGLSRFLRLLQMGTNSVRLNQFRKRRLLTRNKARGLRLSSLLVRSSLPLHCRVGRGNRTDHLLADGGSGLSAAGMDYDRGRISPDGYPSRHWPDLLTPRTAFTPVAKIRPNTISFADAIPDSLHTVVRDGPADVPPLLSTHIDGSGPWYFVHSH